jgi:hypothetical protein
LQIDTAVNVLACHQPREDLVHRSAETFELENRETAMAAVSVLAVPRCRQAIVSTVFE